MPARNVSKHDDDDDDDECSCDCEKNNFWGFRQRERERAADYRATKVEARRKSQKKYRDTHREQRRAEWREYYHRNKDRKRENNKAWFKRNPRSHERNRAYNIKKLYGITLEQWQSLFEAQGRVCAICRSETPKGRVGWHTDHNHATGDIRGILCSICNVMLGQCADSINTLEAAISYLHNPPYKKPIGEQ